MTAEAKLQAFEGLMNEVSAALAEIVDSMASGKESAVESSTALVEIVGLLEKRNKPIEEVVSAIKALRLTVNVEPTPLTITPIVQILERIQPGEYTFTFEYDNYDRLTHAKMSPVK